MSTDIPPKSRKDLLQKSVTKPHLQRLSVASSNTSTSKSSPDKATEEIRTQNLQAENNPSPKKRQKFEHSTSMCSDAVSPAASRVNRSTNANESSSAGETIISPTAVLTSNNDSSHYYNRISHDAMMMSPNSDLIKHHPHETRRTRFDIITGRQLQSLQSNPVHHQSPLSHSPSSKDDRLNSVDKITTSGTSSDQIQREKAPYLNMRQTSQNRLLLKNSSLGSHSIPHGLSTYRAAYQAAPGFYSSSSTALSTALPTGSGGSDGGGGLWDSMRYSKHSLSRSVGTSKSAPQSSFVLPTGSDNTLLR